MSYHNFSQYLSFDDILLVPRYSELTSRNDTNPGVEDFNIPIVMSPMDTITSPEMIKLFVQENWGLPTLHRYFKSPEDQLNFISDLDSTYADSYKTKYKDRIFFAIGSIPKYKEWIDYLLEHGVRKFCIDMAHGNSKLCADTIEYIRQHHSFKQYMCEVLYMANSKDKPKIMAGNVATKDGVERLINAGADYIRCGIGGGSICATRIQTAFGVPNFSCILNCSERKTKNKYGNEVKIIADGGIKNSGDMVKALKAGADYVMVGKLLAGTDLAMGNSYNKNKELVVEGEEICYKSYRGMASKQAREGVLQYSSIEGVSGLVRYTGKTSEFLNDVRLNLKAALSYAGTTNWEDFRRVTKVIQISSGAYAESLTHVE
jgi:IMP dehydrogenase